MHNPGSPAICLFLALLSSSLGLIYFAFGFLAPTHGLEGFPAQVRVLKRNRRSIPAVANAFKMITVDSPKEA